MISMRFLLVVIPCLSVLLSAEPCIVLKDFWHAVFFDSFEDGFDYLGANPKVFSNVSIHQCVQSCIGQNCKMFLHSRGTRTCALSTRNFSSCSKSPSFQEPLIYTPDVLFYECTLACGMTSKQPLGMESGDIPNSAITASYDDGTANTGKNTARLNSPGGWTSPWKGSMTNVHYWIAVTFNSSVIIHEVVTQRFPDHTLRGVNKFSVQYSTNSLNWRTYMDSGQKKIFDGNTYSIANASNTFHPPIVARGFKIYSEAISTITVGGIPSKVLGLRFELYGCYLKTIV